jgi:hypothetical protein
MDNPSIISPENATEQPIVPAGQPVEKKDGHILTILSIGVFVILSLGAVIFLYNQNQALKKMITSLTTPVPVATTSPSPTPNALLTGKLYENKAYKFSFTYPEQLTTGEAGVSGPFGGNPKLIESFSDAKTVSEGTDAPFDGFSVWASKLPVGTDFEEYVDNQVKVMANSELSGDSINKTAITVGDIKGYSVNFSSSVRYHFLPSPDGSTIITISRIFANQEFLGKFEQILYTFKFIEMATPIASPRN